MKFFPLARIEIDSMWCPSFRSSQTRFGILRHPHFSRAWMVVIVRPFDRWARSRSETDLFGLFMVLVSVAVLINLAIAMIAACIQTTLVF